MDVHDRRPSFDFYEAALLTNGPRIFLTGEAGRLLLKLDDWGACSVRSLCVAFRRGSIVVFKILCTGPSVLRGFPPQALKTGIKTRIMQFIDDQTILNS